MDRWRGLCRAVIQVEAKLELGRIRHEAGMPWRIEHDFDTKRESAWPIHGGNHVEQCGFART